MFRVLGVLMNCGENGGHGKLKPQDVFNLEFKVADMHM